MWLSICTTHVLYKSSPINDFVMLIILVAETLCEFFALLKESREIVYAASLVSTFKNIVYLTLIFYIYKRI